MRQSTLGTWTLDTQSEVWTELVSAANDTILGGSAVMYRPDLIMKAGGRGADCHSAIASVSALDTKAMPPVWTSLAPMGNVRENHVYLLVLPDGNILATNGENDAGDPVLEPELYDPEVDVWELMAAMDEGRAHHSTAVLLPDARVLVAGGSASAQIFSPPYLWTGDTLADRPIIDSVDAVVSRGFPSSDIIEYGKPFTVTFSQALEIATVSLIRPGSATHGFDFDQRFMNLEIDDQQAGVLTLTAPATPNEAPPGYYMLFILDNSGVPSVATMIKLSPPFTPKNRYLSFVPDDAEPLAFQLKPTPNPENKAWWVDVPEFVNGIYRSHLTDTAVLRTWSEGVVHIGDCRVVPVAGYQLRATTDGNNFTEPLGLSTIELPAAGRLWGDVVGSFINNVWEPPNGVANFEDVVAAIQCFQGVPTAPPMQWVDVEPEHINQICNFNDVFQIILAVQGNPYPFSAPEDCPVDPSPAPLIGDPATFTLVAGSPEIEPGETVDIEVFISTLADPLGAYQVTLEVTGGTSGGLMLADVTVDSAHADYVFNGLSAVPFPDVPRARVGNALIGTPSGVPVSDPGYLATFSYVPCESAYGDFHVSVVVGQDDTSLMDSSATRLAYNGASCTVIGVGIDCNVDSDCDDSNECTIETCEDHACTFSYEVSGTACDDGLFCSATSECDGAGTCAGSGSPCPPKDPVCCELADNCIAVGDDCSTAPT